MADIRMSDEVRTVLGAEGVGRAAAVSLTDGRCVGCHGSLSSTQPANAVVLRNATTIVVRFAHLDCAPSVVRDVPDDAGDLVGSDDGMSMDMTAGLIEHGRAVLPVLMAEMSSRMFGTTTPGGDLIDLLISGLLERGFALVSRLKEAPRKLDGWSATISGDVREDAALEIVGDDGVVFYTGSVALPAGWLSEVDRYGWCVLYVGNCNLADYEDTDLTGRLKALRTAASNGGLVGARIRVTRQSA